MRRVGGEFEQIPSPLSLSSKPSRFEALMCQSTRPVTQSGGSGESAADYFHRILEPKEKLRPKTTFDYTLPPIPRLVQTPLTGATEIEHGFWRWDCGCYYQEFANGSIGNGNCSSDNCVRPL